MLSKESMVLVHNKVNNITSRSAVSTEKTCNRIQGSHSKSQFYFPDNVSVISLTFYMKFDKMSGKNSSIYFKAIFKADTSHWNIIAIIFLRV